MIFVKLYIYSLIPEQSFYYGYVDDIITCYPKPPVNYLAQRFQ